MFSESVACDVPNILEVTVSVRQVRRPQLWTRYQIDVFAALDGVAIIVARKKGTSDSTSPSP
jgi:hypothetical protein